MARIKQSIECWVLRSDGERTKVLLLQVAGKDNYHPPFYQPITGGIKGDETPEQACLRELHEETGMTTGADKLTMLPEGYDAVIDESLTVHKTIFFVRIEDPEIRISPHEHIGFTWSSPSAIKEKLYWQSNKDTWDMLTAAVPELR